MTHVKIPCIDNVHKLPSGEEFPALVDVVKYLVETPNLLSEKDGTFIELTSPVVIPPSENVINVGYDRFFHIDITGVEAEELLREEASGTYLVRESTSNPGEFALSIKSDDTVLHVRIYHNVKGRFNFSLSTTAVIFRMIVSTSFRIVRRTSAQSLSYWKITYDFRWSRMVATLFA